MMLSICTLPMSPAKNSSSVTAALMSLRAGRRSNSLDNLGAMRRKRQKKKNLNICIKSIKVSTPNLNIE